MDEPLKDEASNNYEALRASIEGRIFDRMDEYLDEFQKKQEERYPLITHLIANVADAGDIEDLMVDIANLAMMFYVFRRTALDTAQELRNARTENMFFSNTKKRNGH